MAVRFLTQAAHTQPYTKPFLAAGLNKGLQNITESLRCASNASSSTNEPGGSGKQDFPPTPKLPPELAEDQSAGKVTTHLTLHKCDPSKQSTLAGKERPLVVLFQWLYAKPQSVQKYCALYHDVGLDVLTVRGKLSHFLWPPVGVQLSSELLEYLKQNRPPDEKILVHAFSIGAYNYTIALEAADKSPQDSAHFRKKVIGQIFDSIVIGSYENMSKGITELLPKNKAFRKVVMQTLNMYYSVTQTTTKDTYERLVLHFKENPIHVPTLVFYAENDPMCDVAAMEKMLSNWKSVKPPFEVTKVSWAHSSHAAHLREHREMYLAAWKGLIQRLHII